MPHRKLLVCIVPVDSPLCGTSFCTISQHIQTIILHENSLNYKGTYRNCMRKRVHVQETTSDTGMHNRAITVLHEQWMYFGKRRPLTSHYVTW